MKKKPLGYRTIKNIAIFTIEKLNAYSYTNQCTDIKYVLLEKNLQDIIAKSKSKLEKSNTITIADVAAFSQELIKCFQFI